MRDSVFWYSRIKAIASCFIRSTVCHLYRSIITTKRTLLDHQISLPQQRFERGSYILHFDRDDGHAGDEDQIPAGPDARITLPHRLAQQALGSIAHDGAAHALARG